MSHTKKIQWFKFEPFKSVGIFATSTDHNDNYICPTCGDPCVYNEGTVAQDMQGNDIRAWWFECHACAIYSDHTEGSWNDGNDG